MDNLTKLSELVYDILVKNEKARNSDTYLYYIVCNEKLKNSGHDISKITLADGQWMGNYFTKYPITLMANANKGYRFVGWSGDVSKKDSEIEVKIKKGGIHIVAEYERVE